MIDFKRWTRHAVAGIGYALFMVAYSPTVKDAGRTGRVLYFVFAAVGFAITMRFNDRMWRAIEKRLIRRRESFTAENSDS